MIERLTRQEIAELRRGSDLRGAASVAMSWALVAAAFALVARWPGPLSAAVALLVLGGRQLGLAVLMHDASHRSLFRNRWLNDVLGHWLCGAPVWTHLDEYRAHHLRHHAHTSSARDPDLGLIEPFPTSRRSLVRKLLRDVSGVSGLRRVVGLLLMDFGLLSYSASVGSRWLGRNGRSAAAILRHGARRLGPVVLTNVALAALLAAFGHGQLYLLWAGAYLTTFSLFLRIRSLAEHACTERSADPLRNTRSTRAGWLARLTVAPHHVNYHLEHHLLMTVPHHKLPRLRQLLLARGLSAAPLPGYLDVLRQVSAGDPPG